MREILTLTPRPPLPLREKRSETLGPLPLLPLKSLPPLPLWERGAGGVRGNDSPPPLHLLWRHPRRGSVRRPDRLAGHSAEAIARLPVQHGNAAAVLGDFFSITGDAADAEIVLEGDCSRIKWLGAKMAGGQLTIRGPAGTHLGSGMTGGAIEVHGNVDDWVGAEMRGGLIRIRGSAGHHAGRLTPVVAEECAAVNCSLTALLGMS